MTRKLKPIKKKECEVDRWATKLAPRTLLSHIPKLTLSKKPMISNLPYIENYFHG